MKRYSRLISGLAAPLMLIMAACGDSPTGVNSGDALSDAEIQALLNAWAAALGDVSPSASRVAAQEGIQMVQIDVEQSVNVTAPCQVSGQIGVDGSVDGWVDDETFEADFTMGVSLDFAACTVPAEALTITLDPADDDADGGDANITFEADFLLDQTSFSVSGTQRGGFNFTTSDERTGSCYINLEFSASYTEGQSATSSVSGEICGRSASAFQAYTVN